MTHLTISDLLRAGQFGPTCDCMRTLLRADPTTPVDVDAVIRQYEASRTHLRSVVAPSPFRVVVQRVQR